MTDRVGQQLGTYRLLRLLGHGASADVYLGTHLHLHTQVAIKVFHTPFWGNEAKYFEQEAQAITKLVHPHIVRLLDYSFEAGTAYLVMEYASGGAVRERHPHGVPVELAVILPYIQQISAALQYAHERRLIHRDVKPENLLLNERQEVLLADFGTATLVQTQRTHQTVPGFGGTPLYAAPEQFQNKPGPASDQYSLAVVVYEWLTGDWPFEGDWFAIGHQKLTQPPPMLQDKVPTLSPLVEQVVRRALAIDPRERFASVQAFVTTFEDACHNEPTRIRPSASLPSPLSPIKPPVQGHISQPEGALLFAPTLQTSTLKADQLLVPGTSPALPHTIAVPPEHFPDNLPGTAATTLREGDSSTSELLKTTLPKGLRTGEPIPPGEKNRLGRVLVVSLLLLVLLLSGFGVLIWIRPAATTSTAISTAASTVTSTATLFPGAENITEFPLPENDPNGDPHGTLGITKGSDGALWFVESAIEYKRIGRITTGGTITEFSLPTSPRLSALYITTGPDGALWFTDGEDNRIGRITTSGAITEFTVPASGSLPKGIVAGPDGALWFTEWLGNRIGRITTSGKITEFPLPTANSTPQGIVVGPDGALWFTEVGGGGNGIGRITTGGKITEFSRPDKVIHSLWITAGPDGALWFTENNTNYADQYPNHLGRITTSGTITEFPELQAGTTAGAITSGPDGNLWFTEESHDQNSQLTASRIARITPAGAITEFPLPTAKSAPEWIVAGPDGNLWFTEAIGKIGRITTRR